METLVAAVGFRNVLAHEYRHTDHEIVYDNLQHELAMYEEFSQQVALWVQDRY